MTKYKNCTIIVMHLMLLQGCASSYINDLAREHDVFNKPQSIDKAYIASCGKNNDEYLVVNLEGHYAKMDSNMPFSLLVNKNLLQNSKSKYGVDIRLYNEIVPTNEITGCTIMYDIYYKISEKEYCDGKHGSLVKELTSDNPIMTDETFTGEFGLCQGRSTGNNNFYYNYVVEGQAKHLDLGLKPSVHSYPALRILLPFTIAYDIVTFPLQIVSCFATQGAIGCGGIPLVQI